MSLASELMLWFRAVRAKFFLAGVPPVILGTCIAVHDIGGLNILHLALTLIGTILAMIGTYTFNDYFDYKSGVDIVIRKEDITPFNAGSRVLPNMLLQPLSVFRVGVVSWIASFIIAFYFILSVGFYIIPLSIAGFISGVFYSAPPFRWAYRGLGEALIGLNYGLLITFGSYYVQTGSIPIPYLLVPSLIPAFLIVAVIWINEFPDYSADKSVGKKTLVVRIGKKKARIMYAVLVISSYISLVLGILVEVIPLTGLIVFGTLPVAIKSITTCIKYYEDSQKLTPAMAGTIVMFTSATILLALSYILATLL